MTWKNHGNQIKCKLQLNSHETDLLFRYLSHHLTWCCSNIYEDLHSMFLRLNFSYMSNFIMYVMIHILKDKSKFKMGSFEVPTEHDGCKIKMTGWQKILACSQNFSEVTLKFSFHEKKILICHLTNWTDEMMFDYFRGFWSPNPPKSEFVQFKIMPIFHIW